MKRNLSFAVSALAVGLGMGSMVGCGGSAFTSQPPPNGATITSFTANPATITAGGSSSLTADFSGGTGVITPGNLAVTSGMAVSVNPTATTTYTLTVTPASGTAVTQTAMVTVTAAVTPVITSFAASPTTISAGGSASLTADFSGGTGVITPGNLAVTSGTPVSVSPTATTTYTLTVTPATGAAVTQTVQVTVTGSSNTPVITSFVANPATIAQGGSATLTAVFSGGTGVITPYNIAVTSGSPITVSPTATTAYTLTVTPTSGTAVTQMATVTVVPTPTINSFGANPATIAIGSSATLLAAFSGGTGVITPGNLAINNQVPVAVSPTATTTYTLTVTPSVGTGVTATATITVVPLPTIASFVANPVTINAGGSSDLTAVFANGTGMITPGNLTATSGNPVSVSPTTSTIYTLTVTPPAGTAITQTVSVGVTNTITVDQSSTGPATTDKILGMNLAAWYDVVDNATAINTAFSAAGIKSLRWPGGSWSDAYNWENNWECGQSYNQANSNDDFLDVVNKLVIPGGLDLALTADYGTGKGCAGFGDPTEAASWAAKALTYGVTVSHMTVGNEEYGSWEVDNHPLQHDPTTYAAATAGPNGYYALIKAASPNTLVGVSANPGNSPAWDPIVLANAPYDFVEYHYYPQYQDVTSDTYLVWQAAQGLTTNINTIRQELPAAKAGTPIYVGEMGGNSANPGTQSWSITQGLYAGQMLGEMMNDGVSRATWWIGFGNCFGAGNNSPLLYGWQDWGALSVFSDGPAYDPECPGAGPIGTMSPTARAFQLFSNVAVDGDNVLTATVAGDTYDVRAYAATHSGGTALVLFNLNETVSEPVSVTLSGQTTATSVTVITYSKAIYDFSQSDVWDPPTTTPITPTTLPLSLSLDPWSMNVVIIH